MIHKNNLYSEQVNWVVGGKAYQKIHSRIAKLSHLYTQTYSNKLMRESKNKWNEKRNFLISLKLVIKLNILCFIVRFPIAYLAFNIVAMYLQGERMKVSFYKNFSVLFLTHS